MHSGVHGYDGPAEQIIDPGQIAKIKVEVQVGVHIKVDCSGAAGAGVETGAAIGSMGIFGSTCARELSVGCRGIGSVMVERST
jgi:hypothetical protein